MVFEFTRFLRNTFSSSVQLLPTLSLRPHGMLTNLFCLIKKMNNRERLTAWARHKQLHQTNPPEKSLSKDLSYEFGGLSPLPYIYIQERFVVICMRIEDLLRWPSIWGIRGFRSHFYRSPVIPRPDFFLKPTDTQCWPYKMCMKALQKQ